MSEQAERQNPFAALADDFAPSPAKNKAAKEVAREVAEQVAAANDFPSRQPPKVEPAPQPVPATTSKKAAGVPEKAKRPQRRHTTGRNQQINLKATPENVERFYALADAHGVTLAECFELALDALSKAKK